jgi:hypothetical protein
MPLYLSFSSLLLFLSSSALCIGLQNPQAGRPDDDACMHPIQNPTDGNNMHAIRTFINRSFPQENKLNVFVQDAVIWGPCIG